MDQYSTSALMNVLKVLQAQNALKFTGFFFINTATTEADLKRTTEEKERITKEKDDEIESLNLKISGMEKDYERILDVSLS